MNILIIKSSSFIQPDIEEAFSLLGHVLYPVAVPPAEEKEQNSYLQTLITNIRACSPDFVFSLNFYPFVSYACELLGLRYIAWLADSYHPDYFSPAIRNGQTWLFASDSVLTEELRDLNAAHVSFLPLAAGLPRINRLLKQNYDHSLFNCDVSLFGNILSRDELNPHPLSMDNALKDSTKGYLEGCIACQHQARLFPPLSDNLPAYVWEDLSENFPINRENSLESAPHYFDQNYFNPIITYMDREIHFNSLSEQSRFETIYLYSRTNVTSEKIIHRPLEEYKDKLPWIAQNSTINLVITHRNYKAAIPASAWEIMASRGFLLCNMQTDFQVFPSLNPILYQTDMELLSKAAYFFHHEAERKEITAELQKEVAERHTYEERLKEMLSVL